MLFLENRMKQRRAAAARERLLPLQTHVARIHLCHHLSARPQADTRSSECFDGGTSIDLPIITASVSSIPSPLLVAGARERRPDSPRAQFRGSDGQTINAFRGAFIYLYRGPYTRQNPCKTPKAFIVPQCEGPSMFTATELPIAHDTERLPSRSSGCDGAAVNPRLSACLFSVDVSS